MSDPDPVPSEAPPAPSRISDRAALEAALAGAASLVLGRLLLGRGAGLLAGTAAIAARLLADAAKQRKETAEAVTAAVEAKEEAMLEEIAEETAETEGWPPEPEVPAGAKPFPEASHLFTEPVPAALTVEPLIEPAEAIIEEIAEEVAEDDGWPNGEGREFKHEAQVSLLGGEAGPAPADPFANLFQESPPPAATGLPRPVAELDATIEGFPDYQKATSVGEPHVPGVVEQRRQEMALPAFPSLTAAATEQPGPPESPAGPAPAPAPTALDLPTFPGLASDLPHPEEIWIRAKAETTPVPLPEVPPAVSPPAEPDVALARGESSPFMIFPPTTPQNVRQEWAGATDVNNPFTALVTQPVPLPEPPVPSPEPAPVPALPSTPVVLPVAPIVPEPPPMSAPVAVERPIVAASPSTAAVAPADLPVISLKAPSNPAVIAHESKPVEPMLITTPVETLPPDPTAASWPGVPPQSAEIPAARSAFKAWVVLLLIAAILTFLYRCELQRVEGKTKTAAGLVPAGLPGNPPASPAAPEKIAVAAAPAENTSGAKPLPALDQNFRPGSPEEKARQTLERLMMARSANELAGLVHHPVEAMRQAIQYFPDGNLNPVPILGITLEAIEPMAKAPYQVRIFRVVTDRVPAGFPVAVEDTAEGPRIDFTAFVQCRDQLLDQFVKQPAAGPGRFLVVLRRGHYFGEDITQAELDRMICLEVTSPNPSSAKYPVFVPRDTELGRLALRKFDWDKTYTPVVELAHSNRHMALNAIVEETWRRGTP
ncbi:MAG: hypothetical protein V4675_20430 [Verrucomicrobiota bacterium]